MSATFGIDANATGAVSAVQAVNSAFEATRKGAEGAVTSAKKLEDQLKRQAQRIKESLDPQEKMNRLYRELGQHVQAGRLTIEQATNAGVKYRRELFAAADAGSGPKGAFGASALAAVTSYAAGIVSVGKAVGFVTNAIRESEQQSQAAAARAGRARVGLGLLSQLAAAESDPKEANRKLVAEARSYVKQGAVADDNEGGALLFELAGAGLNEKDRRFAAEIKAAGTVQNVGGAAAAYDAMRTALGEEEVGSFRQFMSKALKAAGPAPGSFEQLPIAAARSGGSAKFLGIDDEFLLAAATVLGKQSGSIDMGGTQLAALLRQIEKSKVKGIEGAGGMQLLDMFSALPEKKLGFGGVLGDRAEAVAAMRTLRKNRGTLDRLYAGVAAAQNSDLAGMATRLPVGDVQIRSARQAAEAKGSLEQVAQELDAERENLFDAARDQYAAYSRRQGRWPAAVALNNAILGAVDILGGENWALRNSLEENKGGDGYLTNKTRSDIESYLQRQAAATERIERNQRSRNAARQE